MDPKALKPDMPVMPDVCVVCLPECRCTGQSALNLKKYETDGPMDLTINKIGETKSSSEGIFKKNDICTPLILKEYLRRPTSLPLPPVEYRHKRSTALLVDRDKKIVGGTQVTNPYLRPGLPNPFLAGFGNPLSNVGVANYMVPEKQVGFDQ